MSYVKRWLSTPKARRIYEFVDRYEEYFCVAFIGLWSAWVTFPFWWLGADSYYRTHDNLESLFSYAVTMSNIYHEHGASSWMPHIAGGIDHFVVGIHDRLGFDNYLLWLFPPSFVHPLVIYLQKFLGGLGAFLLVRKVFQFRLIAAVAAAVLWSFANWKVAFWSYYDALGAPLIPLYLYLLEFAFSAKTFIKRAAVAGAVGFLLGFCSLFPKMTPFFVLGSAIWFWVVRRYPLKEIIPIYLVFGPASLIPDLRSFIAISIANKTSGRFLLDASSKPLAEAVAIFFSSMKNIARMYAVPLILTAGTLVLARFRNLQVNRLLWFGIIMIVGSYVCYSGSAMFKEHLGPFAALNFGEFAIVGYLVPSILGAYFLDVVRQQKFPFARLTGPIVFLGLMGVAAFVSAKHNYKLIRSMKYESYNYTMRNPHLKLVADMIAQDQYRVAFPWAKNASVYSGAKSNLYPGYIQPMGVETLDGYLSLYNIRLGRFWSQVLKPLHEFDPKSKDFWSRRPAWVYLSRPRDKQIQKQIVMPVNFKNFYNLDLLSLGNVKYLVSPVELEDERLSLVQIPDNFPEARKKFFIYENQNVLPRFFVAKSEEIISDQPELLTKLGSLSSEAMQSQVLLEQQTTLSDCEAQGTVNVKTYSPDQIILQSSHKGRCWLVISNNFSQYWRATANGSEREITPAFHTFQAVLLEPTDNEVTLSYSPPYRELF